MAITGKQIGAAMHLLGIYSKDVCEATAIANLTMTRVLKDEVKETTAKKVIEFLEARGIEFTEYQGVCLKPKALITQYEGREGFVDFLKDVLATVTVHGGEICVSGVDERLFEKYAGEYLQTYMSLMSDQRKKNEFTFKILIKEGDSHFVATNYAEYRHVSADSFVPVPFYVYGNKLAIIIYRDDDVTINVTECPPTADGHREQFNTIWNKLEKS